MKELRPYQKECIDTVVQELEGGCNKQIISMATGLGKTFIGTTLAEQYFQKTLWLTHNEELINQSAMAVIREILSEEELSNINEVNGLIEFFKENKHTGLFESDLIRKVKNKIGIIKQDLFEIDAPFTIASIQTIVRRLPKISKTHFDLGVVDECHYAMAPIWFTTCTNFDFKLLTGLSATPTRLDGVSLTDLFDKITFQRDIKFGIDNGYLCALDAMRVKTSDYGINASLDNVRTTAGELNSKDLEAVVDNPKRNELIVQKYLEYAKGRQALCFAVNVKHAQNLTQAFLDAGVRASLVVADETICPDRQTRVKDFKSGKYEVLVNVSILTTGFDYPDVSCIIMARPTKSKTLYMQIIGRGTRLKSLECLFKDCIIIDIVDNTSKHELINTWTLEEDKKTEDKVFISKEKKEQLLLAEKTIRESKMKEIERDQRVVLIPLPKVRIDDTMRNREDATVAQKDWLQKEGYDTVNTHWTKGQASEVLSNLKASSFKIEELKRLGYDVKHGATIGQHKLAVERGSREIAFEKAARARGMNGLPLYNIL